MTLTHRLTLTCVLISAVVGISTVLLLRHALESNMISAASEITAYHLRTETARELSDVDLSTPAVGEQYDTIEKRIRHSNFGPNIAAVKIWNTAGQIVWASDRSLVGKDYSNNHELQEALDGEIVVEIASAQEQQHKYNSGKSAMMEMYVPVQKDQDGQVTGVFEVYEDLAPLQAELKKHAFLLSIVIGSGFLLLCIALWITARHASNLLVRQHSEISTQSSRMTSLVENNLDAIISVDSNGHVVLFNQAAAAMFGRSPDEMVGSGLQSLMPERYREAHTAGMNRFLTERVVKMIGKSLQLHGKRSDGTEFPMEMSLSVSGSGESTLITAIVRDISERLDMEAKLIETERWQSASLMAGAIGHELNNAVAGFVGYADLLKETPGDRELAAQCADAVLAGAAELREHADNLMYVAKPRNVQVKPIVLGKQLDAVTERLRFSGPLKRCKIRLEHTVPEVNVLADETLLDQIIRNLEINAVHAMNGFGELRITSRIAENGTHAEFDVTDNGCGIPHDIMDKIFDVYFTTKKDKGGTGLGMFVVKRAIKDMNGYIRFQSKVGSGTIFTVGLPLA